MKWFTELFKHNLAALLTTFRLVAGVVAGLLVAAFHWLPTIWGFNTLWVALILVIAAVLTEPVDGRIARTPGWEPQRYWFGGDGQGMNAHAGAGLFGVLPLGVLVNFWIEWWYRDHAVTVNELVWPVLWLGACVYFVVMTKKYEKAKAKYRGQKAENYEVSQAWFAGFIVVASSAAIHATGNLNPLLFVILLVSTIAAVCYLGRKRLFERKLERDRGDYS
jgi:phosphatidylserine synthase